IRGTLYCGPVLRHPAEPLPAVDLGGRVWLGGRSCKGWPAAPTSAGCLNYPCRTAPVAAEVARTLGRVTDGNFFDITGLLVQRRAPRLSGKMGARLDRRQHLCCYGLSSVGAISCTTPMRKASSALK